MGPKWSGAPGKSTFAWVGAFYALFILQSSSTSISSLLHLNRSCSALIGHWWSRDSCSFKWDRVLHYGRHNLSVENLGSSEQLEQLNKNTALHIMASHCTLITIPLQLHIHTVIRAGPFRPSAKCCISQLSIFLSGNDVSETSEISTLTQCLGRQGPVCVAFQDYLFSSIVLQGKHWKVSTLEGFSNLHKHKIIIKY